MLDGLRDRVTTVLAQVQFQEQPEPELFQRPAQEMHETRSDPAIQSGDAAPAGTPAGPAPITNRQAAGDIDPNNPDTWGRVPRNAPCPCGSGSKFKHCHGKAQGKA